MGNVMGGKILSCMLLLLLINPFKIIAQQVSLNEIMASNSSVIADEDGDYEDWIEIFNHGDEKVNLEGFYLSDDYADPYMWVFPEIIIMPGEHLLVWASGKDRSDPEAPLHTNFRISRQGEEVFFTNAEGKRIDEIAPTPIPTDMVYGRYPDGTGTWHYLDQPTPEATNAAHIREHPLLMHYWFFDTGIPNNTPLEELKAFYSIMPRGSIEYKSCLPGYPYYEGHHNWRKASMERRNMPTAINYRPEGNDGIHYTNTNMRGLQVRSPFERDGSQNTIIMHLSSAGFEDLLLRFAARDEGAADYLVIDYAVDEHGYNWTDEGIDSAVLPLEPYYQLYEVDFQHVTLANNNPYFKVRIRFGGENMHVDDGSRVTFNNISLDGEPLKAYYIHSSAGDYGNIHPYGFTRTYEKRDKVFNIFSAPHFVLDKVMVDGADVSEYAEAEDDMYTYTFSDVTDDHRIEAFFSMDPDYLANQKDNMLVYPNPAAAGATIRSAEKFYEVRVVDLRGAVVYQNATESYDYYLDTNGFPQGIYFLTIDLHDTRVSTMIQVVRI